MRGLPVLALFMTVATAGVAHPQPRPSGYLVIANPSNPATSVDRQFLKQAFLKKTVRWAHGETIRPVDLGFGSPTRRQFSEEVLGRSVAAVRAYWQQLIFSGRDIPPIELEDGATVMRYVVKHAGAIGYVPASVELEGVKSLAVN